MRYCTGMAIGTYDLFHVGHLFFLKKASELCSRLIVAVDSDERVFEYITLSDHSGGAKNDNCIFN